MNHLFALQPQGNMPYRGKVLMIRQGLDPIIDPSINVAWVADTSDTRCMMRIAPDRSKGVYFQTTSSTNIHRYFSVDETGLNFSAPTAAFAGAVTSTFCSNDYYGFVGLSTSYINAFRWSDHSLITMVKTGLGSVYDCSINPANGYQLVVTHSLTPFVRMYDLRDGSYIDAPTAGTANSTCQWTPDGTTIVMVGASNPYVYKFNSTLTTRTTISTSSSYSHTASYITAVTSGYGQLKGMPHWAKPQAVIMASCNTASPFLFEVDTSNNTVTVIAQNDSAYVFAAAYDIVDNKLYLHQSPNNYTNPVMRKYNGTTYAEEPMTLTGSQNMTSAGQGSGSAYAIINKNSGTITGTVRDVNNNPAARKVRAYRRSDGLLVAETTSNATTGNYTIITPTSDNEAYDVQFVTAPGELLNDLFYSRTTPAAAAP